MAPRESTANGTGAPRQKKPILRWKGLLTETNWKLRLIVGCMIAVASATLSSVQLGFVALPIGNDDVAYGVALLIPVALAALLLGSAWGTGLGVFSGLVMYMHSRILPLDFYELAFVGLTSSTLLLGIAGLLLGILFAFALRNNPAGVKRGIYIAVVCLIVSHIFSTGFFASALGSMISAMVSAAVQNPETMIAGSSALSEEAQAQIVSTVARLGSVPAQAWLDALLMAVFCIAGDVVARRMLQLSDNIALRPLFTICLGAVIFLAFMISAGASFAAISMGELDRATSNMRQEANYLLVQLSASDSRQESFFNLFNQRGLFVEEMTDADIEDLVNATSTEHLLDGYTEDGDGLVVVMNNHVTLMSNNSLLTFGTELKEYLLDEVIEAMDRSIATDSLQRAVFSGVQERSTTLQEATAKLIDTQIAYVYAMKRQDTTVMILQPSDMVFADRRQAMLATTASALVLLLAVFALTSYLLANVVARRIDETNRVLGRIAEGDLDARVEPSGTIEFKSLSNDINHTVDALQGWIAEAESRMDAELATAKSIQEASLPNIFPPYPDIQRFDVYATMSPAREVGGDFYDFFLIGDNCGPDQGKVAFVVADVSGKGVPAALFMMKAKAQLRDYLTSGMEIGEAVENVNVQLCDGNEAGMFVTAWVGVLDYASRHIDYVNAGHNPPLLWQYEGGWRWVKERSGLPLGLFSGLPYTAHSVECLPGDTLLLYSDGVTEAFSVDGAQYGEDRLMDVANEHFFAHPRTLVEEVWESVAAFAHGAERSDDITMLALEVGVPPEVTATLEVEARTELLDAVNSFVHEELDHRLCPVRVQNQLDIAVEELFVNVCRYAYADAPKDQERIALIQRTYTADPASITVNIIDEGAPFDPLAKPDAVTPNNIDEVPIGGLGILMAKKSVDELRYERVNNTNVVTIVKKW